MGARALCQHQYAIPHPPVPFNPLTFQRLADRGRITAPLRIAVSAEVTQLQVADGQPNDGRLIQLASDGGRQGQHFRQLVEFVVFFAASGARRIAGLFFAQLKNPAVGEGMRREMGMLNIRLDFWFVYTCFSFGFARIEFE